MSPAGGYPNADKWEIATSKSLTSKHKLKLLLEVLTNSEKCKVLGLKIPNRNPGS